MGVSLFRNGKWRARINVDRKEYHLGYFETEEEGWAVVEKARLTIKPKPKKVNRPEGLLMDDEDAEKLKDFGICTNDKGYCIICGGEYRHKKLHRVIMNCPDDKKVDHKNKNKLDNRKSNLRICNNQQNSFNRSGHKNSYSGLKGAYRDKNRWRSQIMLDGEKIFLGMFDSAEEAHQAYCVASEKYHGDYGSTI